MLTRRQLLVATLLARPASRTLAAVADAEPKDALAALERRHGGRLGVAILDTADPNLLTRRGGERFPLCSTFKLLAAAFVLARVDRGDESLARRVRYAKADLVVYSPVTEKHAGADGMTVGELCEAAVTLSDNTAGNLLLDSFGGPAGLTAYLRTLGDDTTRLDRREPDLNRFKLDDPRDTTTPAAMLGVLQKTVVGDALSAASRKQLAAWIVAGKTGDKRLRAGAPAGWRVGDKTGSGEDNAANDVAVLWPPDRQPILVTAYYVGSAATGRERDAVLAEVGRVAAAVGAG